MESSELARARALEDENSRMKRIIANLTLENDAMKSLISKNSWGPPSEKTR
jgi:putative transposase